MLGLVLLVATLVAPSGLTDDRPAAALLSGAALWVTDAVAFGLAFWELDCDGQVSRALASGPRKPDFQFPQARTPVSRATGGRRASGTTSTCR